MVSCFVMGAELLLLFIYIRTQITVTLKRLVLERVERELLRPGRYRGDDPPSERPSLEKLHAAFCANSYNNAEVLAALGYALATAGFMTLLSKVRPASAAVGRATALASASAGLVMFLLSQWGFLKLGMLPFYADLYNQFTDERPIPRIEADDTNVTLVLLTPTLVAAVALVATGIAAFRDISWGAVAVAAAVALLSLGTEVVSWVLLQGFAVPVASVVSSMTDAVTAVLWVNRDNPPEEAVLKLRAALFPGQSTALSARTLIPHVIRDNFSRKRLEVTEGGALEVRNAPSNPVRSLMMLACSAVLLVAPLVVVAMRAHMFDAAVITVQLLIVAIAYLLYVFVTGRTATMRRLTKALQ